MLSRSSGGGLPGPDTGPAGAWEGTASGPMPGAGRRAMGGDLMAREWDVSGYTEVKTLGSGGFGDVVLARHDASGTAGGDQVPAPPAAGRRRSSPSCSGPRRSVLASLDDPNVVRLYEYVESPAGAAIVMELVDGVSRCARSWPGRARPRRRRRWWCCRARCSAWPRRTGAAWCTGTTSRRTCWSTAHGASKLTDFGIAARAGDTPGAGRHRCRTRRPSSSTVPRPPRPATSTRPPPPSTSA